jgi:hypothetical protein
METHWLVASILIVVVVAFLVWDRRRIATQAEKSAHSGQKPFPAVPHKFSDASATGSEAGSGFGDCGNDGGGDGC